MRHVMAQKSDEVRSKPYNTILSNNDTHLTSITIFPKKYKA